ncbi:hypothetical protein [Borrelia duttonii]|uniref:Uncharacterized conserved protein n=1 Tax=Borrelia duttonii (strain Ly) TaxID=412419 RepID=B5RMU2_BORDL|nr:uncharacterized conserved protein [Borrelia duttonii Ly]
MISHKNSFFIKEGPKKVDFDMDSVFLQHSVNAQVVSIRSDDIKVLLDEKLLKLDSSLKQRHGELVDYLKKVEGRISRVENTILDRSLDFLENSDHSSLKSMGFMKSHDDIIVRDNEFSEVLKRENNLPNVSLAQEELDALLEGLNEISSDNKKNFDNGNNGNAVEDDSEPKEILMDDRKSLDIDNNLSLYNNDIYGVQDKLSETEKNESLKSNLAMSENIDLLEESSSLKMDNIVHEDGSDQASAASLDEYNKILTSSFTDENPTNVELKSENDYIDNSSVNEVTSDMKNIESDIASFEQDNLGKYEQHSLNSNLNEAMSLDQNLQDANDVEVQEGNKELDGLVDITDHKVNSLDMINDGKLQESDHDSTLTVGHKNSNVVSSNLKKFDNFEDVLKADLNYVDLQNCIKDFEEKNLYDDAGDLEEKVGQDEKLNASFLKEQETTGDGYNSCNFSFTDVEAIINKFNDNDYLSQINLSDEERALLVKFIDNLENELSFNPKGNNFKIKKEYEILQKIKRLLERE